MANKDLVVKVAKEGAAKYFDEQMQLLKKFSTIDSGTGYIEGNDKVIEVMKSVFATMDNAQVEVVDAGKLGHHVVCRIKPENPTGKLIINCHIDTVFAPGDCETHPYHEKDGWAYGLGIIDCKAGFLVSAYAVKIIQEAGLLPNKEIALVYNCDEEIGSPEGQKLFDREGKGAEAAFIFEPARGENGILTYRKGSGKAYITAIGKEAHSGLRYTDGRNACVELAKKIVEIYELNDYEKQIYYNPALIKGGEKGTGTVPADASCVVGIKPGSMEEWEKMKNDIDKVLAKPYIDGVKLECEYHLPFAVHERTEGTVALYNKIHEAGLLLGKDYPEQSTAGSGDSGYWASLGIPCVDGLGPLMSEIHTFQEGFQIETLREKTELFSAVLGLYE